MAGFPPNLDDGELLLPPDIFLDEVVPPSKYGTYRFSCMDEFARHFAALSFVQNHHHHHHPISALPRTPQNLLPNPQLCKPEVGDVWVTHNQKPPSPGYFAFNGGAELGQSLRGYGRTGPGLARPDPFYEFQVQRQVASYLETRARVLQRQRSGLQNRVYPFQGSGFGHVGGGGGGFPRESGGTGVFHPRIIKPTTAAASTNDFKKKQGERYRQEVLATQQRKSMTRVDVSKQEDCCYHLPPEMGLPQDWTY